MNGKSSSLNARPPEPNFRSMQWSQWIGVAAGGSLFLLGAGRFGLRHRFGFIDALDCLLAVLPAGLLLLVLDYVLHHAKLVLPIPLILAVMLLFSFPVFDVGLGLALTGMIGGPALTEWRGEHRLRRSAAPDGENNEVE